VTLAVVAAAPVRAEDVPVQYLVDQKPLKEAVAGTELSFALYADSACSALLFTTNLAVESLVIERLSLVRPKGAPKAPKAARLATTLAGVDPEGTMYLQVTGTGITPIGGSCQAQVSVPQALTPRLLPTGTATTLEPHECALVSTFGVGGDGSANVVVAFHIVDASDQRVPSLANDTHFEPGTVFKTSQGGTIAYGRVCNLGDSPKDLPQGWKIVARQI
jgi:hypothetical protein